MSRSPKHRSEALKSGTADGSQAAYTFKKAAERHRCPALMLRDSAGLHHAAHAGIHGRCGLGLRDVDDGTLGSEEHAGH